MAFQTALATRGPRRAWRRVRPAALEHRRARITAEIAALVHRYRVQTHDGVRIDVPVIDPTTVEPAALALRSYEL